MPSEPHILLLHGDDPNRISLEMRAIQEKFADPSGANLNITRLDGARTSLDDLYQAVNALPFLSDRRLVLLPVLSSRLTDKNAREPFTKLLESMPESTLLVMGLEDESRGRDRWMTLSAAHWLRRWINEHPQKASLLPCALFNKGQMTAWIVQETRSRGGEIQPRAAVMLAEQLGADVAAAGLEIDKLLNYVDYKRAIEPADVELHTEQIAEPNVFALSDALGSGDARLALNLLHRFLEEGDESVVFAMVVRQFRQLLLMREALDQGMNADAAAGELNIHPFVAGKLAAQARRYSIQRLATIYRSLQRMDLEAKTGQTPLQVSLDTFVADLTR